MCEDVFACFSFMGNSHDNACIRQLCQNRLRVIVQDVHCSIGRGHYYNAAARISAAPLLNEVPQHSQEHFTFASASDVVDHLSVRKKKCFIIFLQKMEKKRNPGTAAKSKIARRSPRRR